MVVVMTNGKMKMRLLTRDMDKCAAYSSVNTYNQQQLALKIKMNLQSSRKCDPEVKIVMDFDKLLLNVGLKQLCTLKSRKKGLEKYAITKYSDLDALLGSKWFIRGKW